MESISCINHGDCEPVIACYHVACSHPEIIYFLGAEDDDPATAWCDVCEAARMKDLGWYDYADTIAKWSWVCFDCVKTQCQEASQVFIVENSEKTPEEKSESNK